MKQVLIAELKRRILNILVTADQFVFSLITLGNSEPDETMSAAAWRLELAGRWQGRLFRPIIDAVARLFGDYDHCENAWRSEMLGLQLPRGYRK